MDEPQSTLVATALRWDANGELCSEDFERLLVRLQMPWICSSADDATVLSGR